MHNEYKRNIQKRSIITLILLVLTMIAAIWSAKTGSYNMSASQIISALFGNASDQTLQHVLWEIRLPRTAAALIAGSGLAIAGAVMQSVLRNPLASPFTLGISQGAAFGAAFAIVILGAGTAHIAGSEAVTVYAPYILVISAFCGSLVTVGLILFISGLRRMTPEAVILTGVALSSFFGAATMLIQYFATDMQLAATVFWTFGDVGKAGWRENLFMLSGLVIAFAYFIYHSWSYNSLEWGDETAESLGVHVRLMRIATVVIASLSVSIITAFLGIIGFIGLIAPHIMRPIVGNDYRFLIPSSAFLGSLLLLVSDILSRTVMAPVVLPVGIITSFAGVPVFLFILMKGRRG
jgi:iron complex transport system permease protein